MLQSKLFNIF